MGLFRPRRTPQAIRHIPSAAASLINGVLENATRIFQNTTYTGLIDFSFVASRIRNAIFSDPTQGNGSMPKIIDSRVAIARRFTTEELRKERLDISVDCQRDLYWACGCDVPEQSIRADFGMLGQNSAPCFSSG